MNNRQKETVYIVVFIMIVFGLSFTALLLTKLFLKFI
jgi:hypothetical protein